MKTIICAILAAVVSVSLGEVEPVTVEEAATKLEKDPKVVVVDLRTPKEFQGGHIEGAVNIDFTAKDFEKELAKLDREKTYLMHCLSGGRSSASVSVWERLGFKNVFHLGAGSMGWKKAGQPMVKPKKKK